MGRPVYQVLGKDAEYYGRVLGIKHEWPVGSEIESAEAVEHWLRRLPRPHATACRLIYVEGMRQDEVAAVLGCSKSYLSRLHQQALEWLIDQLRASYASRKRTRRTE